MTATSLTALAQEHLQIAHASTSGRSAHTIFGGTRHNPAPAAHPLNRRPGPRGPRQPGDATLQVLRGRVRLVDDAQSQDGGEGDILVIPTTRHRLEAIEDAVVVLTVARAE